MQKRRKAPGGIPPGAYDLSNASASGDSSGSLAAALGGVLNSNAVWSTEGDYIFMFTGSKLSRIPASIAFDITSLDTGSVTNSDLGSQVGTDGVSVRFNAEGTKCIVASQSQSKAFSYTLATAWDLSTISYVSGSAFTIPSSPFDFPVSPDGTKAWALQAAGNLVTEYSMSTAWDTTTLSATGTTLALSDMTANSATAMEVSADMTKFYAGDSTGGTDKIYQYSFGSPGVLSGSTFDSVTFSLGSFFTVYGICFNAAQSQMQVAQGNTANSITMYTGGRI